ncbi:hypothetical protein [Vibrio sp. AND4]|uniref:hypothetical protein n=1 Tax=Vibrio sp. AND4 TaxID=314289 RepID=UPI00015F2E61|nr:hypothetical protein [Vibrio sp. AND4]EDP57625.1 hypothetical protein AND4_08601 [Vibrio sp. AND4]
MKFTIPLILSAAVLLPNISVAEENQIQVTSDKEQAVSHNQPAHIAGYLPIEKSNIAGYLPFKVGNFYSITTSDGQNFTVYVNSIKGSWLIHGDQYFNIDNIVSVIKI